MSKNDKAGSLQNKDYLPGEDLQNLLRILAECNPAAGVDEFQIHLLEFILSTSLSSGLLYLSIQPSESPHVDRLLIVNQTLPQKLESLPLDKNTIQMLQKATEEKIIDLRANIAFYDLVKHLSRDIEAETLWAIPLRANKNWAGCLLVLDPQDLHHHSRYHLSEIAAANLATAVFNHELVQQFQITIADLEASRWELLNSRNTLRTLFDNIPLSIYIVNKDYSIAAINKHRARQLDLSIPRIVGRKCYKVLFNRDGICPGCLINMSLLEGKDSLRLHQFWKEGQEDHEHPTMLEIASYPVLNDDKNIVQAIMVENDITEKRRLEDSLIQNEKMAAVGQLAAGMAHEINNPLAAIIANAQLIKRAAKNDQDIFESADLIEQAGVRASQTIRDLLRFSRQESYTFTKTDLNDSINKVISLLQFELIKKNAQVILDLQPDMPPINASEDHLQSVWVNLIVNAADAASDETLEIRITTRYANGEFITLVADNGQGIPEDKISKIFTPFFTTKSPGRGTGLGLSICHRIVKSHGGEIRVESRPGYGTKFIVILPEHYP